MPSSNAIWWSSLIALFAASIAGRVAAFEPERDAWLLPDEGQSQQAGPRTKVDPLDYARIKADGNYQAPEYATPEQRSLIEAVVHGDRLRLEELLQDGVNPNAKPDYWGKTALLRAVERGDVEVVRLLLDAGADPDLKSGGYTPLGRAALLGHGQVAERLLKAGANPDLKSSDGNTPLTAAASMNRVGVIQALLASDADPTLYNRLGRTPLSIAALEGFDELVRLMISAGIDVNMRDENGNKPLVSAIQGDHETILELLVDHGATSE